jgi:diguanylate cyclase (GGDEF)-like protein
MDNVIGHLGELSGLRDRDTLDVTLVTALRDLIRPRRVGIYRCVGDGAQQRWLTRARIARGELVASADPQWIDPDDLPLATDHPQRLHCLRSQAELFERGLSLFPLLLEGDHGAVLEMQTDRPLSRQRIRLVQGVLYIYRNLQGLLDYSERDTLTGLLNRKSFDASFYKASLPSLMNEPPAAAAAGDGERRVGVPAVYWLAIVDVDHFKQVNDRFGHLMGDEVLLLLSRVMRGCFRFSDQLYRFGGEEFVVLLRCAGEDAAMLALDRLRRVVEAYPMPQVGRITISVGFTDVRAGDTPAAAFERADRAVYQAKQDGRNRVLAHAGLVREGVLPAEPKTGDVEFF